MRELNPGILGYLPRDEHWVRVDSEHAFTCPYSECAMHCGYAGRNVTHIIVSPQVNYAYVKFENGTWGHGLLNEVIPPSHNKWAATVTWKEVL